MIVWLGLALRASVLATTLHVAGGAAPETRTGSCEKQAVSPQPGTELWSSASLMCYGGEMKA